MNCRMWLDSPLVNLDTLHREKKTTKTAPLGNIVGRSGQILDFFLVAVWLLKADLIPLMTAI